MSPTICRTCLTVLRENSHTFFALENEVPNKTTFREKLNCCIPELALDIIPNAVICTTCSTTLNLAYDFKTKCLEVENKVRTYLQTLSDSYQTQWLNDLKPYAVQMYSNSEGSREINKGPVKQERAHYKNHSEIIDDCIETHEDALAEIGDNTSINGICENNYMLSSQQKIISRKFHLDNEDSVEQHEDEHKPKIEDDLNRARSLNTACFNYESPEDDENGFTKALKTLKAKNLNKSSAAYQQACQQFNLLKVMQSLANQGTEININGSSISNKKHSFIKPTPNYAEQLKNFFKQKKTYERYDCYYCNRTFDRLSLLKTHIISHTGVKPFTCNICGKGCSHKGELNNHMRTHTGEKPFKCSLCEASFSQISNMKIHMRTHTGEKPYKCDYCEKTFSHKCGVKVHMRTHTGERPYKCEICLKTYTHKKDLDDHMRTHTGEKYKCTICSKEITYKKNLNAHMITHSGKNSSNRQSLIRNASVNKYPSITSFM